MSNPSVPLKIATKNIELVARRLREHPDEFTKEELACRLDMAASQVRHGIDRFEAQLATTSDALRDCAGGLRYIREQHGELYGVGFGRALGKADDCLLQPEVSE